MHGHISIRDFAGVVLSSGATDGILCMLKAYFDDSGTHGDSDIVLMAGVFGYPNQWDVFSERWANQLANPCPGKLPLERFHMAHCQAGAGEFTGWKRHETEFLVHELGTIIFDCGIYGFGGAVARKYWDEFIVGDRRRAIGDAETLCIINCFVKLIAFATHIAPARELAMVFDDRPQKARDIEKIYSVYGALKEAGLEITSATLASAKKVLPLQAADLLAWELYQDAQDALAGRRDNWGPRRDQLKRLLKSRRIRIEFCSPATIKKMAAIQHDPKLLAKMADYLDFE